jgi:gamma-glutamylcyclotransferase (GGCT)/AIG2-like uncharacterized protein YtfP
LNQPPTTLFVYGTLLFDEIVQALTCRTFQTTPALLRGFVRRSIARQGQTEAYPAITPEDSGRVRGRLLLEVDSVSARWIHAFESEPPDYQLTPVRVESEDGEIIPATTYVARPYLAAQLSGPWNPAGFEQRHLARYVGNLIPEMRRAMDH